MGLHFIFIKRRQIMNNFPTKLKKLLAVLLCAALAFTTVGVTAFAKTEDDHSTRGYTYIDENGVSRTLPNTVTTIEVTSSLTTWNVNNAWYIVDGSVTISNPVYAEGTVNLLLLDGAVLTVNNQLSIGSSNTLRIYAQSTGDGVGKMEVYGYYGTGSNAFNHAVVADGSLIVNGGDLVFKGRYYAFASGTVYMGNGISGSGSVTINGGVVKAHAAEHSGNYEHYGIGTNEVIINGGTVEAIGQYGIGKSITTTTNVRINGGAVTATGSLYGVYSRCGDVTIDGCVLNAIATGSGAYNGVYGKTVTISDSKVTATGASGKAAIAAETSVTINGGDITARAGSGSYGIEAPQINLGWQNRYRDRIDASSYSGTITFNSEFVLADMFGQATSTVATAENINGNVIMPDPITDYIDENGDVQSRRDFFLLDSMEGGELELQDYWYLVSDDVDIENVRVTVDGDAHILLLNGAELSVPQGFSVPEGSSLGIYMQPHDTVDEIGKLVSGSVEGGDLGVYGGVVDIEGGVTGNAEFKAGLITLRDGEDYGTASGNINIAISNDEDRITAAGFTGSVTVANNLVMLNADGTASDSYIAAGEYEDLEFTDLHTAKVFDGVIPDPVIVDPVSFTVDSVTALPGGECSVDVNIEGEYEASALTLLVHYDTDLLTVEAIEPGEVCQAMSAAGGLINTDITGTPGTAKFIAVMPIDAVSAEGCIFTLNFRVSGEAEGGTEIPITVEVLQFYFMPLDSTSITNISYEVTNGIVAVSYLPGDVNLDGVLDTTDVILVMRNVLEIVEFNDTQAALADFNGDGAIDATDALMMMRAILDLL